MTDAAPTPTGDAVQVQPAPEAKPARQPRQAKTPKPSVGRIVHYATDPAGEPRAAIITDVVDDSLVSLTVFNALGAHPVEDVEFSEEYAPGRWSWPPRD